MGVPVMAFTDLMPDPRDINRDAKWRRLAMKEGPGGAIGANRAA
jgi:hypothetical protein